MCDPPHRHQARGRSGSGAVGAGCSDAAGLADRLAYVPGPAGAGRPPAVGARLGGAELPATQLAVDSTTLAAVVEREGNGRGEPGARTLLLHPGGALADLPELREAAGSYPDIRCQRSRARVARRTATLIGKVGQLPG